MLWKPRRQSPLLHKLDHVERGPPSARPNALRKLACYVNIDTAGQKVANDAMPWLPALLVLIA